METTLTLGKQALFKKYRECNKSRDIRNEISIMVQGENESSEDYEDRFISAIRGVTSAHWIKNLLS